MGQGWDDVEADAIVWLDVAGAEALFSRDRSHDLGVGGVGAGQRERYDILVNGSWFVCPN